MAREFGDVFWYDDDMELIVEEFYANLTQEQANLSFANLMLEPVRAGHPSRTARFLLFHVNSVFCLLVIHLSFCSKHLQNDFRYFFGNLAIADFCFALSGLLLHFGQPVLVNLLKIGDSIYVETILYGLPVCFVLSMVFAITLTSFHRYMLICKRNEQFFTKKRILSLCSITYLPTLWPLSVMGSRRFFKQMAQSAQRVFVFALPYEMTAVALIGILIFAFHFYFMLRLVLYLRQNQITLAATLNKTIDEVRKEKRLVLAILIQGILPYICVSPVIYSFLARSVSGENEVLALDTHFVPILNYSIQQVCIVLLSLNPLFDSVTTLLIVRQYFKALKLALGCKEAAVVPHHLQIVRSATGRINLQSSTARNRIQ